MPRRQAHGLALLTMMAALLMLTACAKPGAQPVRDDTREIDHPDRGMRDSHTM